MMRLLNWTLRVIGLLVLLAAAAVLFIVFYGPSAVDRLAIQKLHELGFKDASLHVENLGPNRALVRGITLGADKRLTLGDVVVTYQPSEAWKGQLETVTVTGAQLRIGYKNGQLDLGDLAANLTMPHHDSSDNTAPPLRRLELRDVTIALELPDTTWLVRAEGIVDFTGEKMNVNLAVSSRGYTARLSGTVTTNDGAAESNDLRMIVEVNRQVQLSPNLVADTLVGEFPLNIAASSERVRCVLRKPAELTLKQLRVENKPPVVLTDIKGRLEQAQGEQALVEWTGKDKWFTAAAVVALERPLTLATPLLSANVEMLGGWVRMGQKGDRALQVQSQIDTRIATVKAGGNVFIESIAASVPITINSDAPITSGFKTSEIVLGKDRLPPLGGSVSVAGGKIDMTADWPVLSTVLLQITGAYDNGVLTLGAKVPPSKITDGRALGRLFSALGDVEVVGQVALDGRLVVTGGEVRPTLNLHMQDAAIVSNQYKITAEGVSGSVSFTDFSPLTTPGHQLLNVKKLNFGKVEVDDGMVQFRIEDYQRLFVEKTAFRVGDAGAFAMHAIEIDAAKPVFSTEVFVEDLNLGDWVTMLSGQQVTGTGRLYGRIPITFRPNEVNKIALGIGFIYARPGTALLDIGSAEKVKQLLQGTDNSVMSSNAQMKQEVMQALSKYEYSTFRFELQPDETGGTMLHIETAGTGTGGNRVVELEGISVNLHNFDQMLNVALFLKNQSEQAPKPAPAGR
jgi:hypothetical protein